MGQTRRFRDIRRMSGLPPEPDVFPTWSAVLIRVSLGCLGSPDRRPRGPPRWARPRGSRGCAADPARGCGRCGTARRRDGASCSSSRVMGARTKVPAPHLRRRSPSPPGARSSGGAPAAARRRAPRAQHGTPWTARIGLRSSRLVLENRDPRIALQAEGEARSRTADRPAPRPVVTELAGRHRRAGPGQERRGLEAHRPA